MMMIQQRTVIVTGAAGTIGFAIAQAFAHSGDHVVIVDLKKEEAIHAAHKITQETGIEASAYPVDITDEEQVKGLVEKVIKKQGRIDVIVNNAGLQHIDSIENFPLEKWNQLINVMLTGPFLLIKHSVPWMKQQRYGRIINISSVHGKTASPFKAAYISAKHGIIG